MNIFIVDKHPGAAAKMLCDKHIVKMPLETAQMLCSVWHRYGFGNKVKYKEAHKNHPCTLWAGDSEDNYGWLLQHGMELGEEYTRRYKKTHASHTVIKELSYTPFSFGAKDHTPHPQCMPDEYKVEGDAVSAYRNYYIGGKSKIAKWNKSRKEPEWFAK